MSRGLVAGSLTGRILAFFAENPGEELTREDIALKFDVTPNQVNNALADLMNNPRKKSKIRLESYHCIRVKTIGAKA